MEKESSKVELKYNEIADLFNNENNNFSFSRELFSFGYILKSHKLEKEYDSGKGLTLDPILNSLISSKKHNVTKIHGVLQLLYLSNIYNYGQWNFYSTDQLLECINSGYLFIVEKTDHKFFSIKHLVEIENRLTMEDMFQPSVDQSYEIIVLWNKASKTKPVLITSVGEFIKNVGTEIYENNYSSLNELGYKYFYRGHADFNFQPIPSVFRGSFLINEKKLYQELLIRKTANFYNCNTVLDHLSLMQHYGLPTRLLDLTTNPLMALYFACDSDIKKSGEILIFKERTEMIKYDDSDSVKIASCMALLKVEEKNDFLNGGEDDHAKLLSVVRKEVGHFEDIINRDHLSNIYFVKVNYGDNIRVEAQSGVFAISANHDTFISKMNEKRANPSRFIIPFNSKKTIREELNVLSINEFTVYTEMTDTTKHLKDKIDRKSVV